MDILITITIVTVIIFCIAVFIVPLAVTHLTNISNAEAVRGLIDRFFMIFMSIPEMLRNGCALVFRHLFRFFTEAARSTGVTGEDRFQRIAGAILLTVSSILGSIATTLILMITFQPLFGDGSEELMSVLPVSPEALIAIEVLLAGIMYGMLLLDVIGVTHITKFYSPEYLSNISKHLKYIMACIFVIGTLGSAYVLVLGGVIRLESFFSNAQAVPPAEISAQANDGQAIYMPNSQNVPVEAQGQGLLAVEADADDAHVEYSPKYRNAISKLFLGTPLVSFFAVLFGAVGLLPFSGLLISGLSFIPALVILGPFWAIGRIGMVLVNHIYSFVRYYLDIFIQRAETTRNRAGLANNNPGDNPPPSPSVANPASSDTPAGTDIPQGSAGNVPAGEQPAATASSNEAQSQTESTIYAQNDPNWNPLI